MPRRRCLVFLLTVLPALAQQEPEWKPYTIEHRQAGADSRVDVSFLLDRPAGRLGFVTVQSGHLATADGKRLRLWGVNITDWSRGSVQIPSKEDSVFYAATLARFGVNCVRLTFLDFFAPRGLIEAGRDDTRQLNAGQLDKLDFWIAELKKRGIYSDLNLVVGRTYKAGDGVRDFGQVGWAKALTFFDLRLIQLQKEFASQLLTHLNPYTKTEYRNEPAIVLVELLNENSLFDAWYNDRLRSITETVRDANFRPIPASYSDQLTSLYNSHLTQSMSAAQLEQLRKLSGAGENGTVPRLRPADFAAAPNEQFQAEAAFYTKVERDYYRDMRQYLKTTLGVHALLLGSNDFLGDQSFYPMLWANTEMDVIDGHSYWQHPSWPGVKNTPMVNDPLWSTVTRLARSAVAGKPYTVSEVNHAFPNDWLCEGIPTLASYAALHDWDALMWYTFEPKRDPRQPAYVGDAFDLSLDPVRMPQLAAGALLFLRGDVSPARQTVERTYTPEQIYETMRMPRSDAPFYTPGFSVSNVMRHKVRVASFEGPETKPTAEKESSPLVSDTGQLAWYTSLEQTGLVTVDTPRSQALIGFVKANGKQVSHLAADVANRFCAISLSSLDDRPIARSARLMLTAGARVQNTGTRWNVGRTVAARSGAAPSLIEPVRGHVLLKGLEGASALTVSALDGAGRRITPAIIARKTPAGWEIPIGDPITTWYEIEVKR